MTFKDKAILVTGSTSGIGAAAARRFGAAGGRVVISGRHRERGNAVVDEITAAGGDAHFIAADLGESSACDRLVAAAVERLGRLDVLVNAAGVIFRADALETSDAAWRETMAVNVDAVFYLSRAAVRVMKPQGGGAIVNVASTASLSASDGMAAYCASKGAVMLLTRAMARDHGGHGIRVNAVCPGDVITPMLEDEAHQIGMEPAAMYAMSVAGTPLGRIGVPEDIAGAILFLASDDAALVTGAGLVLDGASSA